MNLLIEEICVQGSTSFGDYLKNVEEIYKVNINVGGYCDDIYYHLIPTIEGKNHTIQFDEGGPTKKVIGFKDFKDKYLYEFERLLLETIKPQSNYSII